jgi:MFS family permease
MSVDTEARPSDVESRPSTRRTIWQLGAILTGAFILQIAGAALALAVPLRMALDGRPAALIGLAGSASAIGFIVGCLGAGMLVRPIGHIRAFAVLAAVQSIVTLLFALTSDPWLWIALRLVNGVVNAAQFVIVESWVIDRTPETLRGRMMSIYVVCSRAAPPRALRALPLLIRGGASQLFPDSPPRMRRGCPREARTGVVSLSLEGVIAAIVNAFARDAPV